MFCGQFDQCMLQDEVASMMRSKEFAPSPEMPEIAEAQALMERLA
jgi:hypothetical protein